MKNIVSHIEKNPNSNDLGLLALRILPAYYFIVDHGWSKITNPSKWEILGDAFTIYFGGLLDFANPLYGFIAAFSESKINPIPLILILFDIHGSNNLEPSLSFIDGL